MLYKSTVIIVIIICCCFFCLFELLKRFYFGLTALCAGVSSVAEVSFWTHCDCALVFVLTVAKVLFWTYCVVHCVFVLNVADVLFWIHWDCALCVCFKCC